MSVARHTAFNLLGAIVPTIITLVTVPLYLNVIGVERYGVLSLCWILAGYFGFLDLGIGRATAQRMARLGGDSAEARNRLFWSSGAISTALATLALVAFVLLSWAFMGRLKEMGPLSSEIVAAIPFLALAIPIGIGQSFLLGTLEGRRSFGRVNAVTTVGSALTAVLPLLVAWNVGPALPDLVAATLVARFLMVAALFLLCISIVPLGRPSGAVREERRSLLQFGGWATVSTIVGPILVYFDRFAIGALLGATAVAFYVIAYNLIAQLLTFPSALSRALFPRFAELPQDESRERSLDAMHLLAVLTSAIAIIVMALIVPFLHLWLGGEIAKHSAPIAIILLVGFAANAPAQATFSHLQARGRPDLPAKGHLAELIPYLILFWIAVTTWGLTGAAIAWTVRCVADFVILLWLDRYDWRSAGLLASLFLLVLCCAAVQLLEPALWPKLAAGAGLTIVALAISIRWLPEPLALRLRNAIDWVGRLRPN